MLHFRRIVAATIVGLACVTSQVNAADDADTRAAYEAALKCYVVNGSAMGDRRDAGDQAGAARYNGNAKRSFDGAVKLGRMLGYPNRQLNHDIKAAEDRELPRMVKDRAYFLDAVATCKGLGLM